MTKTVGTKNIMKFSGNVEIFLSIPAMPRAGIALIAIAMTNIFSKLIQPVLTISMPAQIPAKIAGMMPAKSV